MRTYEEICDLFVDLIEGNIDEVKVTFTEMKMLDKKILGYMPYIGDEKVGLNYISRLYNCADIIRELCKNNNIVQIIDFKNCYFKFRKG